MVPGLESNSNARLSLDMEDGFDYEYYFGPAAAAVMKSPQNLYGSYLSSGRGSRDYLSRGNLHGDYLSAGNVSKDYRSREDLAGDFRSHEINHPREKVSREMLSPEDMTSRLDNLSQDYRFRGNLNREYRSCGDLSRAYRSHDDGSMDEYNSRNPVGQPHWVPVNAPTPVEQLQRRNRVPKMKSSTNLYSSRVFQQSMLHPTARPAPRKSRFSFSSLEKELERHLATKPSNLESRLQNFIDISPTMSMRPTSGIQAEIEKLFKRPDGSRWSDSSSASSTYSSSSADSSSDSDSARPAFPRGFSPVPRRHDDSERWSDQSFATSSAQSTFGEPLSQVETSTYQNALASRGYAFADPNRDDSSIIGNGRTGYAFQDFDLDDSSVGGRGRSGYTFAGFDGEGSGATTAEDVDTGSDSESDSEEQHQSTARFLSFNLLDPKTHLPLPVQANHTTNPNRNDALLSHISALMLYKTSEVKPMTLDSFHAQVNAIDARIRSAFPAFCTTPDTPYYLGIEIAPGLAHIEIGLEALVAELEGNVTSGIFAKGIIRIGILFEDWKNVPIGDTGLTFGDLPEDSDKPVSETLGFGYQGMPVGEWGRAGRGTGKTRSSGSEELLRLKSKLRGQWGKLKRSFSK